MDETKSRKIWIITNIVIYICYLYIAICIPYMHDDWDWGLDIGITQLKNATLNSRYAGNFFVVVMTRSEIIKNLIISVTAWAIPFVLSCTGDKTYKEKTIRYIIYNIFVMFIPAEMWAQTYGWVSGFANYVISILCLCFYIYICSTDTSMQSTHTFVVIDVAIFLFAVVSQLFLENISISFLFASFVMLIIAIKNKLNKKRYIILLVGNLFGTIIMFSSNIYGELFEKGEALTYLAVERKFVFEKGAGLMNMVYSIVDDYVTNRLINIWNPVKWLVFIMLALALCIIIKNKSAKKYKAMLTAEVLTLVIYLLLMFNLTITNENHTTALSFGIFYVWLYVFLFAVIMTISDKKTKSIAGFCWISSAFVVVPLALIVEKGERLYLTSYMLMAITGVELLSYIIKQYSANKNTLLIIICGMTLGVLFVCRGAIYTDILKTTIDNADKIDVVRETDETTLYIDDYEHEEYLWGASPVNEEREQYFKEFYHIPDDVDVIIQSN